MTPKKKKTWAFEQDCMNSIVILHRGAKVAEIMNEADELSATDWTNARFIVDACNAAARKR